MYSWICKTRSAGIPLSVALIKEKAKTLADKVVEEYKECSAETRSRLKISELEKFTASDGWWHNFRNRYGLHTGSAAGEAASVNMKVVLKGREQLKEVLEEYEASDIFNLDEAALFFRLLPDRTVMVQPNEKGTKKVKGMLDCVHAFHSFSVHLAIFNLC